MRIGSLLLCIVLLLLLFFFFSFLLADPYVPTQSILLYVQVKADFTSTELPVARVMPDRRWFGNTRVVEQKALVKFGAPPRQFLTT